MTKNPRSTNSFSRSHQVLSWYCRDHIWEVMTPLTSCDHCPRTRNSSSYIKWYTNTLMRLSKHRWLEWRDPRDDWKIILFSKLFKYTPQYNILSMKKYIINLLCLFIAIYACNGVNSVVALSQINMHQPCITFLWKDF